jgi:hypothetical protein
MMYGLALLARPAAFDACTRAMEIASESDEAGLTKAASRVVQILEGVIDKPIAPAMQLEKARRRFTILLNYLILIVDRELCKTPTNVFARRPTEVRRCPTAGEAGNRIARRSQAARITSFDTKPRKKAYPRAW